MTTFAIAVPLEAEQRLVAEAHRYGHTVTLQCSGADELATRVAVAEPDAVLVSGSPQYLSARLIDSCDAAGVRLVVVASTPDQQRWAEELGIADAVSGELAWQTLAAPEPVRMDESDDGRPEDAAGDHMTHQSVAPSPDAHSGGAQSARRSRPLGSVITVWGPAGSPGRTSLAITIAAELARTGSAVALADVDTHAASIDPALGLLGEAPGFAAACRLAGTGGLTNEEFTRIAHWHRSGPSGFWVLTGLGRPSRWPELTADRVAATITAARGWVDVVVIDAASSIEQDEELSSDLVAPRRNAATLAALRTADQIVAVGSADPIGLSRFLRSYADLIETVAPERVTAVINKVRGSAIGVNPSAQIAQTLSRFGGIDDAVLIPWDPAAYDAALLSARALSDAAPRSAARVAIRALALERLSAPGAAQPQRRRKLA